MSEDKQDKCFVCDGLLIPGTAYYCPNCKRIICFFCWYLASEKCPRCGGNPESFYWHAPFEFFMAKQKK